MCVAFLAGCGGGGGGGGGSAPPPPTATAPTITTQPQSQTVTTGSAATFTVAASGSGLSYQWNRNGAAIAGATSATYTIQSAALSDSGASFTVVVSNSGGQITSSAATLTANANPEGLYTGTLTNNVAQATWPVFAIVLKDGTFAIFAKESDFAPKVGLGITISGAKVVPAVGNFSMAYTAYTQPGYTFTNGQTKISGTMTGTITPGTITPGTSITGTYTSPVDTGSFTLNAISDYGRAASTATIAGTYHYSYVVGNVFIDATTTIAADGTATVSDTAMCSGPSTYSVPDGTHNAYKVTNSAVCPTPIPAFSGLAAFFPAHTGAALNGGMDFTTDTLVAIADNGNSGLMVIGSK
jgi:hypothetical protein